MFRSYCIFLNVKCVKDNKDFLFDVFNYNLGF